MSNAVPPMSHVHAFDTVSVKNVLGIGDDPAHDFSAKVEATNGVKVTAWRPMYFNYQGSGTAGMTSSGLCRGSRKSENVVGRIYCPRGLTVAERTGLAYDTLIR